MNCPICGGVSHPVFAKYGYTISDCQECHHRFCDFKRGTEYIHTVYGDNYFTKGGAGYSDYLREDDLLIAHGRRYGQLLKRYIQPGHVLDVGSAAGFILKGLTETGWIGDGLEPNARMASHAQATYGLNVQVGTLEDFTPTKQYDLVTMIQIVAHFYDLHRAFDVAYRATRPGGYWLVETWDKDSIIARIFGKNWHEYSPPSTLHWFSQKTLVRLASRFGMHVVASGRPQKWLNGRHAKSLLRYKLEKGPLCIITPMLKLIPDSLPISYPTLDLFWMLFQKSN
jgi:SAM-dependent methyltransferase